MMDIVAQAIRSEYSARILRCTSQSTRRTWCPRPLGRLAFDGQGLVEYSYPVIRSGSFDGLEWAQAGVVVLFLLCMVHGYGVGED